MRVLLQPQFAPGRYQLRVAAGFPDGRAGSVVADLEVPDFGRRPLMMSGVSLTSAAAGRTYTLRVAEPLAGTMPGPLVAAREFDAGDTITMYTEFYENLRDAPVHTLDISVELRSNEGRVVSTTAVTRSSTELAGPADGRGFLAQVPLTGLEPGLYSPARRSSGERGRAAHSQSRHSDSRALNSEPHSVSFAPPFVPFVTFVPGPVLPFAFRRMRLVSGALSGNHRRNFSATVPILISVPITQRDRLTDPRPSEKRPVRAAQVAQEHRVLREIDGDARMPARHPRRIQPDAASRVAADHVLAIRQPERAVSPYQPAGRRCRGRRRSLRHVSRLATERVPHAMHRSYELRPFRIVAKGAPDVADQDVEACRVHMAVGPERGVKLVLVHHLRSLSQQRGQQVERLPRQVNLGVVREGADASRSRA